MTDYFGIANAQAGDLVEWSTLMFCGLFIDLKAVGDQALGRKVLDAAAACRSRSMPPSRRARRRAKLQDDVLGRCLLLQKAGSPGMNLGIRNNLIGLVIGAIPTISKAKVQALDELLERPQALASAQAVARAGRRCAGWPRMCSRRF